MKTFTYLGSKLAEGGVVDAEVTTEGGAFGITLEESMWSVVRPENVREDQGEGQ